MCGILGHLPAIDEQPFRKVLGLLAHRGPDGDGIYTDPKQSISLGHRRLSIIDLSDAADQPFVIGNRYYISFNGEIYNYIELRDQLQKMGHQFRTTSDTEVLLTAYIHWGADCLNKLNGMWAFAIWDAHEQQLFLSRDRFGEKPLFYTREGGKFAFASEMKALLPLMDRVEASEHLPWMTQHMLEYEATERCLVKDIERFPAGHYAIYKNGTLHLHRYWNTLEHIEPLQGDFEDHLEQFTELVNDSVKLRLRADVPLGCSLSGGLDSSLVTSTVMHQSKSANLITTPKAFTAVFPGTVLDETTYADQLADQFNMPMKHVETDPIKALDDLPNDLYYLEEVYRNAPSPMMQLYASFREQNVPVSFDGHGPDELFSGYDNFIFLALLDAGLDRKKWNDIFITYRGVNPAGSGVVADRKLGLNSVVRTWAWHRLDEARGFRTEQEKKDKEQYADLIGKMGHFNYGLYRLFHYTTFPTLLRNYDRFSMRSGVEVRMPFTDHRLVSFCLSLPWQEKIAEGKTKYLMRKMAEKSMQKNLAMRTQKIGFQSPMSNWLKKDWKHYFEGVINSQNFRNSSIVHDKTLVDQFEKFLKMDKPTVEDGNKIWSGVAPYLWEQYFLKSPKWRVLK